MASDESEERLDKVTGSNTSRTFKAHDEHHLNDSAENTGENTVVPSRSGTRANQPRPPHSVPHTRGIARAIIRPKKKPREISVSSTETDEEEEEEEEPREIVHSGSRRISIRAYRAGKVNFVADEPRVVHRDPPTSHTRGVARVVTRKKKPPETLISSPTVGAEEEEEGEDTSSSDRDCVNESVARAREPWLRPRSRQQYKSTRGIARIINRKETRRRNSARSEVEHDEEPDQSEESSDNEKENSSAQLGIRSWTKQRCSHTRGIARPVRSRVETGSGSGYHHSESVQKPPGSCTTDYDKTYSTPHSDFYHQIYGRPPPPLENPSIHTQIPQYDPTYHFRKMRVSGYGASNGVANNIVEEYLSPDDDYVEDYQSFKVLTDSEKQNVIAREAEEFGLERPKGWNVSFHYNPHVEYHHFGSSHPMKPWRLTLTKQLVLSYGLEYTMDLYEPRPANFNELAIFHDRDYLSYLSKITPQNAQAEDPQYISYGFGGESNDCPVFDGLWNYVSLYTGASMSAAWNLLNKQSDIAINWSGGLHHAKKNLASGFCYVNDIVIAIQLLLTQHQRVLYIDIDVHHGDGVEQAFESTDRVFTLSYHKYGIDRHGYPFFPGTGNINEMGPTDPANRGKGHSLNLPIDDGIDDDQYKWLFKTVTGAVIDKYNPQAIVLQSGADSLGGDRLGRFNLNIKAHGYCIETVKSYGHPLLLIGGGGYTPRNVARTWCHETSVCVGAELHNELPAHIPYIQAFQGAENGDGILYPDLHNTKRHENLNSMPKLQKMLEQAMENLRYLEGAPSVVVNTKGIGEEELMRVREMVEQELEDEAEDQHYLSVESNRRRREKNTGGRGERGLR